MKYTSMVLGDFATNCYLVWDENTCNAAVIDPGYEPERILSELRRRGLTCRMILLTHGHFDHVGAVGALVQATHCSVYLHEKDLTLPAALTSSPLPCSDTYQEGDAVELDGLRFTVMETPGHTMGSVCLITEGLIFSGDTLFAGACGRTDLGGNTLQILQSLKRLAALEGNYTVLPGHGPSTTLDKERKTNPYILRY